MKIEDSPSTIDVLLFLNIKPQQTRETEMIRHFCMNKHLLGVQGSPCVSLNLSR